MRRIILIFLSVLICLAPCGCGSKNDMAYRGKTNEETSILISKEVFKKGSDSVVISAGSEGIFFWSGTAFAGIIDAPVLIYENKKEIDKEIKRLKAKNIYIFGSIDYTPKKSAECVRFSVPETVTADAAKYIKENLSLNYSGTFLVTSNEEAAAIAPQAYKNKMPIFLILKGAIPENITPHLAEKNYLVGDGYADIVINSLGESLRLIPGESIVERAGYANGTFDKNAQSFVMVKEPVDIAVAASFAKSKNAAVIYYTGRLTDTQENFMYGKPTDKVYFVGTGLTVDSTPGLKKECESIAKHEFKLDTNYKGAVFYVPHQDDETIFYSQVICRAIETYGAPNVKVVLFTDGAASGIKKVGVVGERLSSIIEEVKKHSDRSLSDSECDTIRTVLFSRLRDNEIYSALADLGILKENIRSIGFGDGQLENFLPQVEDIMAEYYADPQLVHFAFSPYYDSHPDHRALGQALLNTAGETAENVFFFARFDVAAKAFFDEPEYYNAYRQLVFGQTPSEQLGAAIGEYKKYSCDSVAVGKEIASYLNRGMSAVFAVKKTESVNSTFISVGSNSVQTLFLELSDQLVSGNIVTVMHKPFIRTVTAK